MKNPVLKISHCGVLVVSNQVNRRLFVKLGIMGLTAAPLGKLLIDRPVQAASAQRTGSKDVPKVDVSDTQAKAIYYAEDATLANGSFRKSDDQFCHNCHHYSGQEGVQWGPCAIFSYRVNKDNKSLLVNANGWCRLWGPRSA